MNFETKLCRICLNSDINDDFIDIFGFDSNIVAEIFTLTSIKITQKLNRIDLICFGCLEKLNIAKEFRENCIEADKYFQQLEKSFSDTQDNSIEQQEEQTTIEIEIIQKHKRKTKSKKLTKKNHQLKHECSKCDKNFSSQYYLEKHNYAIHTEINPEKYFECDNCVYRSKTKLLMRSHQINNHSFSSSKVHITFQCKFCGRICMSHGALYSHERTHKNLPPEEYLRCLHCPKKFKEKKLLKNHIQLVHEKSRMKQCSECGFIATCSGSLNKHNKAVHLKLRHHICDECKKGFATNQQLLRHLRSHSGERPFKCFNEACDKFFADSHGRKRHLKICSFSK